jgi:hypothetical protein
MKKISILLTIAIFSFFSFNTVDSNVNDLTCDSPDNVTVRSQTSTSITFDWDACSGGCDGYLVYYQKHGSSPSGNFSTDDPAITFSNLPAGTYDFYFATKCTGGGISSFIVIEDQVLA